MNFRRRAAARQSSGGAGRAAEQERAGRQAGGAGRGGAAWDLLVERARGGAAPGDQGMYKARAYTIGSRPQRLDMLELLTCFADGDEADCM